MNKLTVLLTVFALALFSFLPAHSAEDIDKHKSCAYCGMDREKFAHTRMLLQYEDGSSMGNCSIHCAAVDLAQSIDKKPTLMKVGDYNTKNLIDAETAVWVVGGQKPGVMSKRGKWAFEKKADAEAFAKENGGDITDFDGAIKAAFTDMYEDVKMIRERRAMKKKQMMEGMKDGKMDGMKH